MKRFFRVAILIAIIFSAKGAFAAGGNWYVLKGATGANNGTNWTNAWNEMNQINLSAVSCGDTIWLAGGAYNTTLAVVKNCSSSSTLFIKRVLSTDSVPVAAAGWNSSFDSQVIILDANAGIRLNGIQNVVIDGRFGNPTGASPVAYGILIHCATLTACDGIHDGASNGTSTLQNIEVYGPPCVPAQNCTGGGASGFFLLYGGTRMNFHNIYVHQWGELWRAANWANTTIENSFLCCTHNDSTQHEDILYDNGGSGAVQNLTMRYNTIWQSPNDGIFFDFGGQNGFYFYGNVYYHSGGQLMTFKPSYTPLALNVFIYNNIFENDGTYGDFQPAFLNFSNVNLSSGAFQNNVMQQMYLAAPMPSPDYNAWDICGNKDTGTHSFCYTAGTQLINTSPSNPLLANFRLTSAGATTFQNGVKLSFPYNMDMDGSTRGANGSWYIGAYQNSGSQTQAPQPPTGLVATAQ